MSTSRYLITTLACTLLLLSACSAPPKRQAYSAPDNIGAIDTTLLPGTWQQTLLNPLEGEENADVTISFTADSSVKILSQSKTMPEVGIFEGTGTWKAEGDRLLMNITDMNETSGNELATLALSFMRRMINKTTGSANPIEMNQNRIVWLIEDSGQAVQLDRIN